MMDKSSIHIKRYTDEELMDLVLERNARSLKILYERYSKSIFNFILRFTNSPELSEDILQETFTRVWFAAHTFNSKRGTFKTWMFTIALNICRNEMGKKRYQYNYLDFEELSSKEETTAITQEAEQSNLSDKLEMKDLISGALERLNPFLREIVILKHYQELKFSEIAEITNTPEGTLKARFHTALAKLKIMLEKVEI